MLALSPAQILAPAVFVHVLALAPGLGCALAADCLALSTLVRPLGPRGLKFLGWLHKSILVALIFMWMSGLAMVAAKLMPGGAGISPKLAVKLGTVLVLSMNALAIGRVALPHLLATRGQLFGTFNAAMRLRLGLIGGVSSACWMTALALGLLDFLKPLDYGYLAFYLGPIILAGFAAGIAVAVTAPWLAGLFGRASIDGGPSAGVRAGTDPGEAAPVR